jgi:hypothetical protein
MVSSDGFFTMEIGFSVTVSVLRIGRNRHWSFLPGTSFAGNRVGALLGLDALPFVGRLGIADLTVGQPKQVGAAPLRIAGAPALGNFDKPESAHLSQGRRDGVAVKSILYEVVERDGEPSVIVPAMVGHLDFQPIENPMPGKAQSLEGWRFHHLDSTRGKLAGDPIPSARASVVAHNPAPA